MIVSRTERTAVAALLVRENGDRNICAHRGALESLCLEEYRRLRVRPCEDRHHRGSVFALKKLDGEGVRTILERARNAGAATSADMKFDAYGLGFDGIRNVFPFLDYFLPNYEEALYLTSGRSLGVSATFSCMPDAGMSSSSSGSKGALSPPKARAGWCSSCPARRVDTTGAGDISWPDFLPASLRGMQPEEAGPGWEMASRWKHPGGGIRRREYQGATSRSWNTCVGWVSVGRQRPTCGLSDARARGNRIAAARVECEEAES